MHWVWLGFFAVWLFILSGLEITQRKKFDHTQTRPGVIQALQLKSLLKQREEKLTALEANIDELSRDRDLFLSDPTVQEHEIRKTLGYTRKNEIVFDFNPYQ